MLQKTAAGIRYYKRSFLFQVLDGKNNLADQNNKNSCEDNFQDVFQFTQGVKMINVIFGWINSQVH